MKDADRIRLLHTAVLLVEADLDTVEGQYAIDLGRRGPSTAPGTESTTYAQFPAAIRAEAKAMARHYELFYCLENSIRELVNDQMVAKNGSAWWDLAVPQVVRDNVVRNMTRERDAGITARSADPMDYTTFGELGDIIRANWEEFGAMFKNEKALSRVLSGLNLLRGPIAHCSPLAEDEQHRLELGLRDWFRLMS